MKRKTWCDKVSAVALAAVALAVGTAGAAVNFAPMDPTWSIPMQVTTNGTANGVYSPVSVITSSMNLKVTFGVTNTVSSATSLPAVSFKIQDATGAQVKTWTKSGGTSLPGGKATWIDGGDCTSYIRSLAAGNYRLEAKLGTDDTKYFRFAVRDTSKTLASVFTGSWRDVTAKSGNDFAAPPFAAGTASSGVASGTIPTAQFGPYVPMDGIVEYRPGSEKAPLDLVFLIDLTGSMGGCIDGLKSNVETFFRALVEGDADHEPITNWRAKVVGYRDYFVDYSWYEDHPFTTNVTELVNQIASCTADGGGDGPESLLDAVWAVSNYTDFREDASHVMLAFTDIGYKGTGLYHAYEGNTNRLDSSNPQYNVDQDYDWETGTYVGDSLFDDPEYQAYLKEVAAEAGGASTDAELTVKVIASAKNAYYHFDWLVDYCYPTNSSFTYVSSLASFSSNPNELRNLAQSVSATVKPAEIVEPMLSARVTGPGVLTYEWRNVSEAGANNTFRFKMTGGTPVEEERSASSSSAWTMQTYVLGAGDYTCQWFYKKLGYDGGLVDCGQVRNIAFAVEPGPPVVTATDGSSTTCVTVSWTAPTSVGTVTSYEISRALKGGTTVLGTTASTTRTWEDSTATPGVDYTYRVRAQNSAGWGDYGSDNGWRKVSLSLSPTTLTFDYSASSKPVTVTANTTWEVTGQSGCATATAGSGAITVSVTQNTNLSSRTGSITVTAGRLTAHPVTATVSITQSKRPGILTKLEIIGGDRTLEGGESTSFRAIATFDDGTTRDVTSESTWTIISGSGYGTVSNGSLTTYETTDTGARITVQASYTNSGYSTVTKTDSVDVAITFTERLRRPVSLTINGSDTISIGETKMYTATVTYNDGSVEDKTFGAEWTVTPGGYVAKIVKGSSDVALTAYSGVRGGLTIKASYSEKVAAISGLVACYNLNGNTLDTSGYGNHGVANGAVPTEGRNGEPNNAYLFDGNDWIQVANSPSLRAINNQISISTWVKPTAWASNISGDWVPVVCKGLTERQYGLQVRNDGRYDFKDEYGVSVEAGSANSLQLGEWQHIAMTYDGSIMRAYLNGRLVGETRISRSFTANDDALYIGYDRPGQIEYLTGAIDDVRIFNRALSVEEIASVATEDGETVTVTGTKNVMMPMPIDLAVAVDLKNDEGAPWNYSGIEGISTSSSVGGNVWYGQSAMSHDSTDAGQSGHLFGAGTNTMTVVVTNAGTVSFWWKVSSEPVYDTLSFSIDGVAKARISGTSGEWRQLSFSVGAGRHTFEWAYGKDGANDAGQDAGWVDQIVWTPLAVPGAPGVSASDGSSVNGVDVTWTAPATGGAAESYEISRAEKGSGTWTVLTSGFIGTAWTDSTAVPGVDYTYRVRARNAAGSGAYGSDDGWRGISLEVNPSTLEFEHLASAQSVAVKSSASSWTATAGEGWITVAKGTTNVNVSVGENAALAERTGTVTVTAGSGAHAVSATVTVTQVGRPPTIDVGFAAPFEDWRTRMQVSTNTTPDTYYAPVSVFTAGEPLDISFGWTNKSEVAVSMPPVRFRIFRNGEPGRICVSDWTAAGRAGEILGVHVGAWSGHWTCDVLKVLKPGDYLLEAEIAPAGSFTDVDPSDNTAMFRFAVRDPALSADDTFPHEEGWTNLMFAAGNDFAQPPHVAVRQGSAGTNETTVQFGPYVPMNGVNGHASSSKNALDLVFLVDYSGSQSTTIQGLVNNIGDFIDQLFLGDPANGVEPVSDLRVKIAGFSDYKSDRNWYEWFYEGEFTTDRTRLKSDLSYIKGLCNTYGGGGYNGGESSYDALYYICKGWRPNKKTSPTGYLTTLSAFRDASEASRAVILITDEPPHLPLDANGCSGKGTSDLAAALSDANINLTIVGDGEYRSKDSGQPLFAANKLRHQQFCNAYPEICELIETGGRGTLPEFTGNVDKLKWLAATVAAKVVTVAEVVEPVFSAAVRGGGTLKFDWKNDSMATTNNTFSFECEGVTNLTKAAGGDWETVTLELGEGLHVFNWSYGKLGGYVSDIVTDCGVLSNVRWEPWHTELEIEPPRVPTYYTGLPITQTNDEDTVVFDVTCNSIWKVVGHSDWITVVQGNGTGNGDLVVTVATNMTYEKRTGFITVRAGEYGLPSDAYLGTPEVTVFIEQEATPYNEDGSVEVLTVDIKPRWPWDRKVDIDFRVKTPAKEGTPVRVKVWGLNKEGGSMITNYPTAALLTNCMAKTGIEVGFGSTNYNPVTINTAKNTVTTDTNAGFTSEKVGGTDAAGEVYILCPTSGLYRFTWKMAADWQAASAAAQKVTKLAAGLCPWANGYFHTPEFSVRLRVEPDSGVTSANPFHEMEAKNTRRVDMRLLDLSTSDSGHGTGREGGSVLTHTERIGHPFGYADPVVIDTTDKSLFPSNGWNNLDFMAEKWEEEGVGPDMLRLNPRNQPYTLTNRYDIACILNNDNVAVEGGMITNDVRWTADRIHVVRDNVFVAKGAKLTIAAGAIVKMCIDTRIYILEDETATIVTNRHNIIVEGSYFANAVDHTYGGDTLYLPTASASQSKSEGGGIVYSQVKSGKTVETEEIYGSSTRCSNRAIYRLELKETYKETNSAKGSTVAFQFKYYSRGQKYGDFLLHPSRPGCEFYGWYKDQPTGNNVLGQYLNGDYEQSKSHFVDPEGCPYNLTSSYGDNVFIYALVCPIGWAEAPVRRSATSGNLVLVTESVMYDGNNHSNDIKIKELWLGAVDISNSISSVDVPSPCRNVGEYPVTVNFEADYTDSPTAMFRILPRSTEGGTITFSPASVMYNRSPVPSKPSVAVALPDMASIPSGDCTVSWVDDAGRWPRPGKYTVVATFNGNYTGPSITNEFTVVMNPAYVYTEYTSEAAARAQVAANPTTKDGTAPRRILYIGGRESDALTEYVKELLANDIDLCDYVSENFVCWADDIDAPGSKAELYADGLPSDMPPILAIVSTSDMTRPVTNHVGYITRDGLWEFLTNAKTLPNPPVDASSATLTLSKTSFTYNGSVQKPSVTVRYAGSVVPAANYDLIWEGACNEVGTYGVKAVFKGAAYTGETAPASFAIVPASIAASAVTLTPSSATYDGVTHKPVVSVSGGVPFTVDYGSGDYTSAGNYAVAVTASGNYVGTVNNTFSIARKTVTSATVELDTYRVEISGGKMPSSPVKPSVISVSDATRTYVDGVDYTINWGAGDYMTPSTNTITATFIGNYAGTATARFVIDMAPAVVETPMIDPTIDAGVDVAASGEAAAIAMVKVKLPADVASTVSFDTYQTYYTKKAVYDALKKKWTVTAELKREVVLPGEDSGDLSQAILDAVLDDSTSVAVIPAVPGLYYRLLGSATLPGGFDGDEAVLAESSTVTLPKPSVPANRAFFKVTVAPMR